MELASRLVELLWIGANRGDPALASRGRALPMGRVQTGNPARDLDGGACIVRSAFLAAASGSPSGSKPGERPNRSRNRYRAGARLVPRSPMGVRLVRDVLFAPSSRSADPTRLAKQFEAPRSPSKELAPGASIADQDRRASRTVEPWTSDPSFRIGALGLFSGPRAKRSGDLHDPRPIVGMAPSNGRPGGLLAAILGSQGEHAGSRLWYFPALRDRGDRIGERSRPSASWRGPSAVRSLARRFPGRTDGRVRERPARFQRPHREPRTDRAAGWIDSIPSVHSAVSDLPPVPVSLWTGGLAAASGSSPGGAQMRFARMVARARRVGGDG